MHREVFRWIVGFALIGLLTFISSSDALAEPSNQGPEICQNCHRSEVSVWEGSKHFKSMKKVHRSDKAKKIVAAIGEKRMKRSETCTICHYTMVAKGAKTKAVAGPSCESCHGPSSDWFAGHNDYGKGAVRDTESAEHKAERIRRAAVAGMIWPSAAFDVAVNCFECHGMSRDGLSEDTISKMLDAGHPISPDYELVRYSQGSVRHRFYPPDRTKNAEMTPPEMARLFITGHAASLVSATRAFSLSNHPKYVAAQEARIGAARAALESIQSSVPEAGTLLQDPSEASARALVAAINGKDLSGSVGSMLPPSDSYK